jgi:O-antigen biosynthesis protein
MMSEQDDDARLTGYGDWRRSRLDKRLESAGARRVWNHLITVLVDGASANADAVSRTLSALHCQTYRNIEIVVTGVRETDLPDLAGFASLRGLFAEPELDALDVLSDPVADRAWRGSHLVFAAAGTTFDPDAFALLNRMLSPLGAASAPDLIICDHDRIAGAIARPCFLPGWDPDLIVAMDYIGTAFMTSRKLVLDRRSPRPASLHDWLRGLANGPLAVGHLTETVMHLPTAPPRPLAAASIGGLPPAGSVAIVIPNRDRPELLSRCVRFLEFTEIAKLELVVVDHASTDPATLLLYADLQKQHGARILKIEGRFNFSRMVNLGVAATTAEVVMLLNNDVEVTQPHQVEMMIGHAMRPEVGVVGACLLYANDTVQHAGVILRPGPDSEHPVLTHHVLRGSAKHSAGYLHALRTVRNYQAVTGAIIATRRAVFDHVGGFDEVNLPVEYNDVDYCLRARAAGFRVISLPTEGIIHPESSTRGGAMTPEVRRMRAAAIRVIVERWRDAVDRDPFCNPNVDLGDRPQAVFPWTDRADVR